MKWTDIYDIAISLEETHPDVSIETIRFTDLQKFVLGLDEFHDDPKRCNEKVLEAIQAAWLEERS
jgi:FeS assembly protein IscX